MENKDQTELSIFLCGVGGQGVTSFGQMLAEILVKSPLIKDLVSTESRGVSQREGMVYFSLRALLTSQAPGKSSKPPSAPSDEEPLKPQQSEKKIYEDKNPISLEASSLTPKPQEGQANIYIGLEPLEFFRNIRYLHPTGLAILNTSPIIPKNTILSGDAEYPQIEKLVKKFLTKFPEIEFISKNFSEIGETQYRNAFYGNLHIVNYLHQKFAQFFPKKHIRAVIEKYPRISTAWDELNKE